MGRLGDEIGRLDGAEEAARRRTVAAEVAESAQRTKLVREGAELAREFVTMAIELKIPRDASVFNETYDLTPNGRVLIERHHVADCWHVLQDRHITVEGDVLTVKEENATRPGKKRTRLGEWWAGPADEQKLLLRTWDRAPLIDYTVTSSDGDGGTMDLGQFSYYLAEFLRRGRQ